MIIMKRLLVVVCFVLTVVSITAVAQVYDYTLVPWQYGVIAWVQTPPANAQRIIDQATQAMRDVFSFWNQPLPKPAPDWRTPRIVDRKLWLKDWVDIIQNFDALLSPTESPRDYFLAAGIPVVTPNYDKMWLIRSLTWNMQTIFPLKLIVFPDREMLNDAFSDYSLHAFFSPVSRASLEDPAIDLDWYLMQSPTSSMVFSTTDDLSVALAHGLAYWVLQLWCEEHAIDTRAIPRLVIGGFASYCTYSLTGDDTWRMLAAQWAVDCGLTDVPQPLLDEVGASFITFLVEERGKEGFLQLLADPEMDWEKIGTAVEARWKASLSAVEITVADRALYEAKRERLQLCLELLSPILPHEATEIVNRLYDRRGTTGDIKRFWQLVSIPVPAPSDEGWMALSQRILTFMAVQIRDNEQDTRKLATRLSMKLGAYSIHGNWEGFISWYMRGIREIISRHGELPYHWRSMRIGQYWLTR